MNTHNDINPDIEHDPALAPDSNAQAAEQNANPPSQTRHAERQYEQSGLYPKGAKPFRMWALFGWLTFIIVALAGVSAILNLLLI